MPTVGALYRIRTKYPDDICINRDDRWSGVKVGHGRRWRLRLPPWDTLKIPPSHWNFFNAYIGLEFRWVQDGHEYMNGVEAGLSIRGCEVNRLDHCDFCGGKPVHKWHSFVNFTPRRPNPPYNDPAPYAGAHEDGLDFTLELRTVRMERISSSYRWQTEFFVNGQYLFTAPLYGANMVNRYQGKIVVGGEMLAGSDPNAIAHGPFTIEQFQVGRAECKELWYINDKTYVPVKAKNFQAGAAAIVAETAYNTIQPRDFTVSCNAESYFWTVELPPP